MYQRLYYEIPVPIIIFMLGREPTQRMLTQEAERQEGPRKHRVSLTVTGFVSYDVHRYILVRE